MSRIRLTLLMFLTFAYSQGQNSVTERSSLLSAGYLQVNESANFGLIFKGPGIDYGMRWNFTNERRRISYECKLGTGVLFSREIPALGFYLKPMDLSYMFRYKIGENVLFAGPGVKFEYHYNLYPDLQSGFDYWFTNLSLGINAVYDFKIRNSFFSIKLNSSMFGLSSRQPVYRDPYFFDLGFGHAVKHLHQDLTFGSFSRYNSMNLEILWKAAPGSRISFGYELSYARYNRAPEISICDHRIKMVIKKKQK